MVDSIVTVLSNFQLVYQTKTRVLNSLWINKTLAGEETADVHANLLQCVEHVQVPVQSVYKIDDPLPTCIAYSVCRITKTLVIELLCKQYIKDSYLQPESKQCGSITCVNLVVYVFCDVQDSVFIGELILSSHYPTLDMTLDTLCLAKNKVSICINTLMHCIV